MATIYLMGGLGNNLFQLNLAYTLKDAGSDVVINTSLLLNKGILSKFLGWTDHNSYDSLNELKLLNEFIKSEKISYFVLFAALMSKLFNKQIFNVRFYGLNMPKDVLVSGGHFFGYYHNISTVNENFLICLRKELGYILEKRKYIWQDISRLKSGAAIIHIRGGILLQIKKTF